MAATWSGEEEASVPFPGPERDLGISRAAEESKQAPWQALLCGDLLGISTDSHSESCRTLLVALPPCSQLTIPEMPPATKLMPTDVWSFGLSLLSQRFTNS